VRSKGILEKEPDESAEERSSQSYRPVPERVKNIPGWMRKGFAQMRWISPAWKIQA